MSCLFNFLLTKKARGYRIDSKRLKSVLGQLFIFIISKESRHQILIIFDISKVNLGEEFKENLQKCSECVSMCLSLSGCIKGFLR